MNQYRPGIINTGICNNYRESLKTEVFRDLPLKSARFAAQRARNCKGTSKNNRFLEVPYILIYRNYHEKSPLFFYV
jgi:hypothetical protein